MTKVSEHITLAEATKSQAAIRHGIDNTPNDEQLAAMKYVATRVFEPLRIAMGNKSIAITSFFRSPEVNKKIGGSTTSQHCKGQAMDIDADVFGGMTNAEIFRYIYNHLEFDQLIWEYGNESEPAWVHVSLKEEGDNRKQSLMVKRINGKPVYSLLEL